MVEQHQTVTPSVLYNCAAPDRDVEWFNQQRSTGSYELARSDVRRRDRQVRLELRAIGLHDQLRCGVAHAQASGCIRSPDQLMAQGVLIEREPVFRLSAITIYTAMQSRAAGRRKRVQRPAMSRVYLRRCVGEGVQGVPLIARSDRPFRSPLLGLLNGIHEFRSNLLTAAGEVVAHQTVPI